MIGDLYEIEIVGIVLVSLAIVVMAIRRARRAPPYWVSQKLIRYGKAIIGLGWAALYIWLLVGSNTGDMVWIFRTFVSPGIFFTLCLTLMALIEC